jgi:hypothetical protein
LNIQSNDCSEVFAVADGIVAFIDGDRIFIDFMLDGEFMQAIYGNILHDNRWDVGDHVQRGELIGQMIGIDIPIAEIENRMVLEFIVRSSINGLKCEVDGSNSWNIDPAFFFDLSMMPIDFLYYPMASFYSLYSENTTPLPIQPTMQMFSPFSTTSTPLVRPTPEQRLAHNLTNGEGHVFLYNQVRTTINRENAGHVHDIHRVIHQNLDGDATFSVNFISHWVLFVPIEEYPEFSRMNEDKEELLTRRYRGVIAYDGLMDDNPVITIGGNYLVADFVSGERLNSRVQIAPKPSGIPFQGDFLILRWNENTGRFYHSSPVETTFGYAEENNFEYVETKTHQHSGVMGIILNNRTDEIRTYERKFGFFEQNVAFDVGEERERNVRVMTYTTNPDTERVDVYFGGSLTSVEDVAKTTNPLVMINAGFFGETPNGYELNYGWAFSSMDKFPFDGDKVNLPLRTQWNDGVPNNGVYQYYTLFYYDDDGRARIVPTLSYPTKAKFEEAIKKRRPVFVISSSNAETGQNSRSMIGVREDGSIILMSAYGVISAGSTEARMDPNRPTRSIGITVAEGFSILTDMGAKFMLNLDGGGSTQFYYANNDTDSMVTPKELNAGSYRPVGSVLQVYEK